MKCLSHAVFIFSSFLFEFLTIYLFIFKLLSHLIVEFILQFIWHDILNWNEEKLPVKNEWGVDIVHDCITVIYPPPSLSPFPADSPIKLVDIVFSDGQRKNVCSPKLALLEQMHHRKHNWDRLFVCFLSLFLLFLSGIFSLDLSEFNIKSKLLEWLWKLKNAKRR